MDVVELGPLRVRMSMKAPETTSENAGAPPLTVVLMHGYGAPGDDLVGLADAIEAPPWTRFVFPVAPTVLANAQAFGLGDARQWWPVDIGRIERAMRMGTIEEEVNKEPEGLGAAREAVIEMLDVLEDQLKVPGDRIVLGGFSQGAMLATDVALRTKRPLAGLVVLSGTLLAASTWLPHLAARKDLLVFQSHGTADPILPYAMADRLRQAFEAAGLEVRFRSFDGGHGIPPGIMRDLGAWLRNLT